MRVFVTGIAGMLGSHLADALIARGDLVDGNDNLICGDEANVPKKMSYALTDCRSFDPMLVNFQHFKPDVLVHCAATAHEGLSSFSPSFVTKNIYEASVTTFSAAIAAGVKRIVFMSSMARYGNGWGYNRAPFTEDMIPAPVDPYGIAKVAAEETLKILCKTHGVKYSIAVPHNILGTKQRYVDPYRNVASIMINRCKQGKPPIIYGDGKQKRCFSPIKDVLSSLLKMVDGAADGEVINLGPDKSEITINELAYKIIDLTDFDGLPEHIADRPNEVKEAYCSSDKARKLLGYSEQQSLDDCLKEMVDYIKPKPFQYGFPIEIKNNCPSTWLKEMM